MILSNKQTEESWISLVFYNRLVTVLSYIANV